MDTFTKVHPSGLDVLTMAYEGGSAACEALARTWITEGVPVAFSKCPAVYDSMRAWLADKLDIYPKQIGLTGSARLGSSFVANKAGRPFGPRSDLDFFLVSEALFTAYCDDFCNWRDDFSSDKVRPNNAKEREHWEENAKNVPTNIKRRFINVWMIPARPRYKTAQHTLDVMSHLVSKLKATPRSPSPARASVRCYENWGSLIKQVAISLKDSSVRA